MRSSGAGVAARRALGEDVDRRVEPDGDRALVEQLARARIDEGAAAGGDHPDLALDQPRDQPPLAVAEILLAVALEHLGGGIAGGILDRGIAVDEGQAEAPGQAAPDRRLSDPHQPDQHHRPVETLAQFHHLRGYTAASALGKSRRHVRGLIVLDRRLLVVVIGGALSSSRPLPKEQPTQTIEVAVPQARPAAMRTKPLLIASAAVALALPALAQQARQPRRAPAPRRTPTPTAAAPRRSRQPRPPEGGADESAVEEVSQRSACSRRRRRSNIPAGRGATRGRSAASTRATPGSATTPWGGGERRVPVDPDAADGHAARLALGAYRAARRAARQGSTRRANVNPVDWVAERAWLLLRMGEADAARMLVAGVDTDRFTPKMVQVAVQSALANADPPALCPLEDGIRKYDPGIRRAGPGDVRVACRRAGSRRRRMIDQARRYGRIGGIDLALAEKVVGAGANGRAVDHRVGSGRSADRLALRPCDRRPGWCRPTG